MVAVMNVQIYKEDIPESSLEIFVVNNLVAKFVARLLMQQTENGIQKKINRE